MKDKASYVNQMFTAIAPKYDRLNRWLSFRRDKSWRQFAVAQCVLKPGGLALDVCTGTAELARELAHGHNHRQVIGVDFNPDMLARAKAKLATVSEGTRIHLVMADGLKLPFLDGTFDCTIIGFALRNVTDIAATFREMTRVVRLGGRVVSLELTRPPSALIRTVYYLYLRRIVPFIGGIISGKKEAYIYLPESILEFPSPEKVAEIMQSVGLHPVAICRLTFGSATVQVGIK